MSIYKKSIANILKDEKIEYELPLRSGTRQDVNWFLFNVTVEILATAIMQGKEIKHIQITQEEVKFSLFLHMAF